MGMRNIELTETVSIIHWRPYRSIKMPPSPKPLRKEVVSLVDSDSPSAFDKLAFQAQTIELTRVLTIHFGNNL